MEIEALTQLSLTENGEKYLLEERQMNRVTNIIGKVFPPYLVPWAQKVGIEGALAIAANYPSGEAPSYKAVAAEMAAAGLDCDGQKDEGGRRGSELHGYLERYIKDGRIPKASDATEEAAPYVQSLAGFLVDYRPELRASELTVYHEELGYAGTIDAYGVIRSQPKNKNKPWNLEGKSVLLDTKTNKHAAVYYPQHHFQLAAYRLAWDTLGLPQVDHEIIVALGPAKDGKAVYRVGVNYVPAEAFQAAVATYGWLTTAAELNPNGRRNGRKKAV